jgi:hypothetical protein
MDPLVKRIFDDGGIFEHLAKISKQSKSRWHYEKNTLIERIAYLTEVIEDTRKELEEMTEENKKQPQLRNFPEDYKTLDPKAFSNQHFEDLEKFEEDSESKRPELPKVELPLEPRPIPGPGPIPGPKPGPAPIPPPYIPPVKFDRLGDWQKFNQRMIEYLQIPIHKYGAAGEMNDLLHYTGLRVMCWHLLKYSLRIWLGFGKRHDLEKIAHFAQMAWTRARSEGRTAPFFDEDEMQKREFISKG